MHVGGCACIACRCVSVHVYMHLCVHLYICNASMCASAHVLHAGMWFYMHMHAGACICTCVHAVVCVSINVLDAGVCLYMPVCNYVCPYMYACRCVCVLQRSEVSVRCLPCLLSTMCFEIGSLTKLGIHPSGNVGDKKLSGSTCVFLHSTWDWRQLTFMWVLGCEIRISFSCKHLIN